MEKHCLSQEYSMYWRAWSERCCISVPAASDLTGNCDYIFLLRRRIATSLLPDRKESDLILYYYNVWKTRATPRARAWFTALEQVARLPSLPCSLFAFRFLRFRYPFFHLWRPTC